MCDASAKLIAWLDGELPDEDVASLDRHLHECSECGERVDAYRRASCAFDAYCDAVVSQAQRPRPSAVVAGAFAAVAAIVMALFFVPRTAIKLTPAQREAPMTAAAIPGGVPKIAPHSLQETRRRRVLASLPATAANWTPEEPAVEIAIPAEAIFPPGAVPDGVDFVADVTIAADGSAQGFRLQPQFALERKPAQP